MPDRVLLKCNTKYGNGTLSFTEVHIVARFHAGIGHALLVGGNYASFEVKLT